MSRAQLTPAVKARIAFMRFGLGPKPGGAARIGMDENSALEACLRELNNPAAARIPANSIKVFSTEANSTIELTYSKACWFGMNERRMPDKKAILPHSRDILSAERSASYAKHMVPEVGFVERLVLFWSNHFSVWEGKRDVVRATAGHLNRAVIRHHVLGKFSDMLKGVITHPAMIVYLDNHLSSGANSKDGPRYRLGLNENLAREILELHTVGVNGGYTQADVTNFAQILTGWTIYHKSNAKAGQFFFNPDRHEPGAFTVMRKSFAQEGQAQGLAVLDMLAKHPSTARHIAFKLLLHFVTDRPSAAMVDKLKNVFIETEGDLKEVARALLQMSDSWTAPMTRLRQPYPWIVSQMRGMGFDSKHAADLENRINPLLHSINHLSYRCMTPDGYPDENYNWENPNAIRMRKDVSGAFVSAAAGPRWSGPSPEILAAQLLPGAMSKESADEIARWKSKPLDALNILFVTPEYLRR